MKTLLTILIALTIGANAGTHTVQCELLTSAMELNIKTLKTDLGNKAYVDATIASITEAGAECNMPTSLVDAMVNSITAGYTRYTGTN